MQLNQSLLQFRDFMRSIDSKSNLDVLTVDRQIFSHEGLGTFCLNGEQCVEFKHCLDAIESSLSNGPIFSRRAIEMEMQKVILQAIRADPASSVITESNLKSAIAELRASLTCDPKRYLVYIPIVGLGSETLPAKFGKVDLMPGTKTAISQLRRFMAQWFKESPYREEQQRMLAKNFAYQLSSSFLNHTIARLEVFAGDEDGAEQVALAECRRALDILNFYADMISPSDLRTCVSFLGEGHQAVQGSPKRSRVRHILVLRERIGEESALRFQGRPISGFAIPSRARGPLALFELPHLDSLLADQYGLRRISDILSKDAPSSLEDRLLGAFQWAGRATVGVRREEAFMFYVISLESLVLGKRASSEITFQLKLKTSHILEKKSYERKKIMKKLSDLYGVRSKIVHSGSFQVTDSELKELRYYVKQALLIMLNDERFRVMSSEDEFESWMEERLVS